MGRRLETSSDPEEWRAAPDADGYEVSSRGRVRSWRKCGPGGRRAEPKVLKPYRDSRGYLRISARINGQTRPRPVHRWVLEAFVGPRPEGMDGCHNNGIRTDNRAENLRWDTRAGNLQDTVKHGTARHGERHHNSKLTWGDVDEIRRLVPVGHSLRDLASRFGVTPEHVSKIARGLVWRRRP